MLSRILWFTAGLALIMAALLGNIGAVIGSLIDPADMVLGTKQQTTPPSVSPGVVPGQQEQVPDQNGNCPAGWHKAVSGLGGRVTRVVCAPD